MRAKRLRPVTAGIVTLAFLTSALGVGLAGPAVAGAPGPGIAVPPAAAGSYAGPYADSPAHLSADESAREVSAQKPRKCAAAAAKTQWSDVDVLLATAVALGESDCDPKATGTNPPSEDCPSGSRDRGAWQINSCYHPDVPDSCAYNLECSAKAAYDIWASAGDSFNPWTVYRLRLFKTRLSEARRAVKKVLGKNIVLGVVTTSGGSLTIRERPTTKSDPVGTYANDAIIRITCQTRGQRVYSEVFGYETRLWDSTGPNKYVSDGYVYTDASHRIAPRC